MISRTRTHSGSCYTYKSDYYYYSAPTSPPDSLCTSGNQPDPTNGCLYQYILLWNGCVWSQVVQLIAGAEYVLSFYISNQFVGQYSQNAGQIQIANQVLDNALTFEESNVWSFKTYSFVAATSGSSTLSFISSSLQATSDIDSICLRKASDPAEACPLPPNAVVAPVAAAATAAAFADIIQGHHNQKFVLPLQTNKCFNLYSTSDVQLSLGAAYVPTGLNRQQTRYLKKLNRHLPATAHFVRSGNYLNSASVRLGGDGNNGELVLSVSAGSYDHGFSFVTVSVANGIVIDLLQATAEEKRQTVNYNGQTLSLQLIDPYRIKVSSVYFNFQIVNSDNFINIELCSIVDLSKALSALASIGGILGQTLDGQFPDSITQYHVLDRGSLGLAWSPFTFDSLENGLSPCYTDGNNNFQADKYFLRG
jgi:hypothetical protein